MMINVSRFTGVQNYLKDLVLEEVKRSRQAIGNYAGLTPEAALLAIPLAQLRPRQSFAGRGNARPRWTWRPR